LNTVPLIRGLEQEIVRAHPSQLAAMLQRDELDAALVSVTEPLLHDRYDILDGIAIASLGEVKSILLAHRRPLEEMREVYCDTASLASFNLLRVLLAEKGLKPEYKPLSSYDPASLPDYAMLIGDQALDFLLGPLEHEILDLGVAWYELTHLPCVHAVWALRRDIDTKPLRFILREAKDFGLDTLDYIINSRKEYTLEFRKDYLGWHIHFHMCTDEKRGLARLAELMNKHGLGPVYEPRYVS
jgi:chorismate dehydratase